MKTSDINGEHIMLDIYTDMVWIMCKEWKDATLVDGNENY